MEFTPENAPAVASGFLLTCIVLLITAATIVYSLATRKHKRARRIGAGGLTVLGIYFGILLTFSLTSDEKMLALNEQKYFCEIDCHLAYSVVKATASKTLGVGTRQTTALGMFYVVTVKVWFDERTITPRRGNFPLMPDPRAVSVLDNLGREYEPSPDGQIALEESHGKVIPLTQPLRPGESYTTSLVFDLPTDIKNPRLLIATEGWITRFLIEHENSLLHKKITFKLEPEASERDQLSPAS